MRDATLVSLVHAPLLAADDLSFLCGIGARGARRALAARGAAGEAGHVADPATRRHLYYLTADGVAAAAHLMDIGPDDLTGRYGLGKGALLHRLAALPRLLAGRRVLLHLAMALPEMGGTLEAWRAFPVRWPYRRAGRAEVLVLDGQATLRFADGLSCVVGYIWDGDPDAPLAALATRLERLAGLQACPAYAPPAQARVPPVLLITASAERIPVGYRPGLLWTTIAALDAAGPTGPLAACWSSTAGRDGGVEPLPLRAALDRLGTLAPHPTPSIVGRVAARTTTFMGPDDLRGRVAAVRVTPSAMPSRADLLTLPLALPPRSWPLLLHVGQHPLLGRHDVAAVSGGDPHDAWEVLRALCRHGLCQAWRPNEPRYGRAWRYSLTTRGTTLLARSVGLSPATYRRIYGVLDDARCPGERGLVYARGNLAHTDGISAAFLAFLRAVRARGGDLWWRGEWACTRPYLTPDKQGRERTGTLRPDAELRYAGPGGPLHAFLEIDRDTESAEQLAGKIDQYHAYRAHSGDDGFAVLVITPGPKRGGGPLARVCELARDRRQRPLDVRVTTATALSASGPWSPIWRDAQGATRPLGT